MLPLLPAPLEEKEMHYVTMLWSFPTSGDGSIVTAQLGGDAGLLQLVRLASGQPQFPALQGGDINSDRTAAEVTDIIDVEGFQHSRVLGMFLLLLLIIMN